MYHTKTIRPNDQSLEACQQLFGDIANLVISNGGIAFPRYGKLPDYNQTYVIREGDEPYAMVMKSLGVQDKITEVSLHIYPGPTLGLVNTLNSVLEEYGNVDAHNNMRPFKNTPKPF